MNAHISTLTNSRTRRSCVFLAFILFCTAAAGCLFPGAVEDLDVKQVESIMKSEKKLVIIDNRTEMEYSSGHIPGASNIPQQNLPMITSFLPADKDTPLIFYCGGYS